MDLIVFSDISGVPVHYDRYETSSGYGYGTRGKPSKPRATRKMIETLEHCFEAIIIKSPFGNMEVITTAGVYVNKSGQHGKGQAFDLDAIFWEANDLVAIEFPAKIHLYLAVESIIRRYFGTVLCYNYNRDHEDHFHFDLGTTVRFDRMSKSRVEYLQASIFYIHGLQVRIDGFWGPEISEVSKVALVELGISGGLSKKENWIEYLNLTAERAFSLVVS